MPRSSPITTHVLDTALGRPAAGLRITLEQRSATGGWRRLGDQRTDADGRIRDLLPPDHALAPGVYRMTFDTGEYHRAKGAAPFYPSVAIDFEVRDGSQHYHVPLLLSPFGYTTYRGS